MSDTIKTDTIKSEGIKAIFAGKRRARVAISLFLFKALTTQPGTHVEVCRNDIPDDAKVVTMTYDHWTDTFYVILESDTFPITVEGQQIPDITGPHFMRVDDSPLPEFLTKGANAHSV